MLLADGSGPRGSINTIGTPTNQTTWFAHNGLQFILRVLSLGKESMPDSLTGLQRMGNMGRGLDPIFDLCR